MPVDNEFFRTFFRNYSLEQKISSFARSYAFARNAYVTQQVADTIQ